MLNNKSLISYSLLAFCLAFVGLPIYIYLPNYYADNFSIDLQTIALILLITRLIDTLQDPLFGILSDRFPTIKKKIITFLSPFLGLSFLLLFYPLTLNHIELWLIILLITTYSLFSLIYINYQSYAVSFSEDYHLKTKIISYREIAFIIGIIFAAASPALLFEKMNEIEAFFYIGIVYCLIIALFSVLFYYQAPHSIKYKTTIAKVSLKSILQKPIFRLYFLIFLLNSFASAIPAVLILFFVETVLQEKSLVGFFLLTYFFGLLLGVILWTKLSKYFNDKIKTFVISIIFTACIFIWCYFLGVGDIYLYTLICFLSGLGFGGDLSLAYSILTDLIQKHQLQKYESAIFGIINFITKLSLTIASASLIYIIGSLENQISIKIQFISFAYAIIPVIFRSSAAYLCLKLRNQFINQNL